MDLKESYSSSENLSICKRTEEDETLTPERKTGGLKSKIKDQKKDQGMKSEVRKSLNPV